MILGVGIDIVDIERMSHAVQRTPAIVHKILTQREYDDLASESDEYDDAFVASLSARFAAKEATVKSLGMSLFSVGLHSIEIRKKGDVPYIEWNGESADRVDNDISFLCSLTHSARSAAAVVIAQK